MSRMTQVIFICFGLFTVNTGFCSPGTEAIVSYLGVLDRVRYSSERLLPQVAKRDPQAAEALRRSLKYMNREEVVTRSAAIFDHYMTSAEIKEFSAFMGTPLGRRFGVTFRANMEPKDLENAFAAYPEADKPELNRFVTSPAGSRVLEVLSSREWHQTWQAYGELLMCRYFEREEQKMLEIVRKKGKCLSAH